MIRCVMARFEDRQRDILEMRAPRVSAIECEKKTQIGVIRFQQCQPPEVVSTVAGNHAQPRVEQVVGLLNERPVMSCHHLDRFSRGAFDYLRVTVEVHHRQ